MTPDTIALARRLLALGVEPFMVPAGLGTAAHGECRITVRALGQEVSYINQPAWRDHRGILWRFVDGAWLPDVADRATQGVLVGAVEDADGSPVTVAYRGEGAEEGARWTVRAWGGRRTCEYGSERWAALVAALESAHGAANSGQTREDACRT